MNRSDRCFDVVVADEREIPVHDRPGHTSVCGMRRRGGGRGVEATGARLVDGASSLASGPIGHFVISGDDDDLDLEPGCLSHHVGSHLLHESRPIGLAQTHCQSGLGLCERLDGDGNDRSRHGAIVAAADRGGDPG